MRIDVLSLRNDFKNPLSLGSSSIFLKSEGISCEAQPPTGPGVLVTFSGMPCLRLFPMLFHGSRAGTSMSALSDILPIHPCHFPLNPHSGFISILSILINVWSDNSDRRTFLATNPFCVLILRTK